MNLSTKQFNIKLLTNKEPDVKVGFFYYTSFLTLLTFSHQGTNTKINKKFEIHKLIVSLFYLK